METNTERTFKVIFKAEPEGGFTVTVPALEGCITYGKDLDEAMKNAKEAISLHLECLMEDNVPIPSSESILETNLEVAVSHG